MAVNQILNALHRRRKYAGFFDWPDHRVKESAIVQRLSEALKAAGELGFMGVVTHECDPPDCIAITHDNRLVAVEVIELVDNRMAAEGQRRQGLHRDWTPPEVLERLQEIIDGKHLKCSGLGCYSRVLLLIHTDEAFLQGHAGDLLREAVQRHTFRKPKHFDDVVLLVSYDPRFGAYPYSRGSP